MTSPIYMSTAEPNTPIWLIDGRLLGFIQRTSAGWWGTLNHALFLPSTCGPAKTLRALTKRMEKLAADVRYQKKETKMETNTNTTNGAAPHEEPARTRTSNPPRVVALARLTKVSAALATVVAKTSGFDADADTALNTALEHIELARAVIGALPEHAKPKRMRTARANTSKSPLAVGAAYEVKERYRDKYNVVSANESSVAVVTKVLDDGNALVMFMNEGTAAMRRTHLGKMIATEV